jgi:[NiFe] hydrogenase diaphorase moiety small subunit
MPNIVTLTVDGKSVSAAENSRLLDALRINGTEVPSLCYYPHIDPPLGTCRVCTVLVDGRPTAACTALVQAGSTVVTQDPTLQDQQKAMVEMLFVEGNHFCPACEKSGDCDLQGLGYQLGIHHNRFPHLFIDRRIDYNPSRIVIEHNRCIRCRRCVEEVLTDDGMPVFAFANRGNRTEVAVDYDQERKLSEKQALRAMHICPTGAILVSGKSLARPDGDRKYDVGPDHAPVPVPPPTPKPDGPPRKMVIATTSLAGCFGCHMSMLDIDLELLDYFEMIRFDKSPLTDIKSFSGPVDLGLIEGGCCNSDNVEVLREFRKKCRILVSVGECAIWGGLPAMRNTVPLKECLETSYLHSMTSEPDAATIPRHNDIPAILDQVYACSDVVDIDYFIPGCPPDAHYIWKVVRNILFGEPFSVLFPEFKYD